MSPWGEEGRGERARAPVTADAPREPSRAPAGAANVDVWRRQILERATWLVWLVVSVAATVLLREALTTQRWSMFAVMASAWTVVGLAATQRRLDLRLRGAGLYLGIAIAALGAVVEGAFRAPNAFLALMMVVVLLALALGRRAAWVALLVSSVGLVTIAGAFTHELLPLPTHGVRELRDPTHWIRVIAVFAAVTAATAICVSFLTSKLEGAMLRGQALLDALASESQQRLEALERERALFAQLQQAQKLEAVGTLAGGVAHDFNNLLLVILGHIELMRTRAHREPGDGGVVAFDTQASMQAIEESAQRAAALTRQLLTFSRKQVVQRHVLDVDEAIERSLALIGRLLPSSIDLRVHHAHEPLAVRGTQVELDQILMNLCVNARDAMPHGGTLDVTTSLTERARDGQSSAPFICIAVRDDGLGMSEDAQQRMFDPFFTTKAPDRGTGLGLSVVHGIVSQAGGFLEVTSAPDRGTEIRVYLPRDAGEATPSPNERAQTSALHGDETILLVEDDPRVRTVTATILSSAGYRVITAADGVEGLQRFRASPREIDLLVTDAVMPRMGGRELHEAISLEASDLPCLICSGYAAETLSADLFVPNRLEFLQKPYGSNQLLARVRALLDASPSARVERVLLTSRAGS